MKFEESKNLHFKKNLIKNPDGLLKQVGKQIRIMSHNLESLVC